MSLWFSIEVRFLTGRYHGRDANTQAEWPPTPLRLFQAIVAGTRSGRWAVEERAASEASLRWLETLGAPQILLASPVRDLKPYRLAVPSNQADRHIAAISKGALLDRLIASDKEMKDVRPRIVPKAPIIYAWSIPALARTQAEATRQTVRKLIALGTGLDHAVADVRLTSEPPNLEKLVEYPVGDSPCEGTLDSLTHRHQAWLKQLQAGILRENLPKVKRRAAAPATNGAAHFIFSILAASDSSRSSEDDVTEVPIAVEATRAALLAHTIRLTLAADLNRRLLKTRALHRDAVPEASIEEIERLVIGRNATAAETAKRLQISPLPSIGHQHADRLLRRVLVSVPAGFPIPAESVRRALTGCEFPLELSPSYQRTLRLISVHEHDGAERRMRDRYLGPARIWRSVSPVILPGIRPASHKAQDHANETSRVRADMQRSEDEAILFKRALAHAGCRKDAVFRLQREPFGANQPRADADWKLPAASGDPPRPWLAGRPRVHAEIIFNEATQGPLLIGDGRFFGLGLFRAEPDETTRQHCHATPRC